MSNVNSIYVGSRESVPYEKSGRSYYFYPENEIMPEKQVEKAKEIVVSHAKSGKPYTLVTVSPYVLKAVETWSDLLEQGENVEYFDPNGRKSDVKTIFKELAIPFAKLVRGEHWEPEA